MLFHSQFNLFVEGEGSENLFQKEFDEIGPEGNITNMLLWNTCEVNWITTTLKIINQIQDQKFQTLFKRINMV
jgi:hypothetical protein